MSTLHSTHSGPHSDLTRCSVAASVRREVQTDIHAPQVLPLPRNLTPTKLDDHLCDCLQTVAGEIQKKRLIEKGLNPTQSASQLNTAFRKTTSDLHFGGGAMPVPTPIFIE